MNAATSTTVIGALRRMAVPLAAYYAITLALPLANGAARSGAAFGNHAMVVLVLPVTLIVLACVVREIARAARGAVQRFVRVRPQSGRMTLNSERLMRSPFS